MNQKFVLHIGVAAALTAGSYADITYPAAAPAPGTMREWEGRTLTPAEKTSVTNLINCVKALGTLKKTVGTEEQEIDLEACAACMTKMLNPDRGSPRICMEGGTSTNLASTYSGRSSRGACDPSKAQMNVAPGLLTKDKEIGVAVFVHEWVHMSQAEPVSSDANEKEGYWWETETLDHFITEVCAIVDDESKPAEERAAAARKKARLQTRRTFTMGRSTYHGGRVAAPGGSLPRTSDHRADDGGFYYSFSDTSTVIGLWEDPASDGTQSILDLLPSGIEVPLAMTPLPGVVGPNGGGVLAVAGTTADQLAGTLMYAEISQGTINEIPGAIVDLPGPFPSSLLYQPLAGRLLVLDGLQGIVYELLPLEGPLPNSLGSIWTPAPLPGLGPLAAIGRDPLANPNPEDTILVYDGGYQVGGHVFLGTENLLGNATSVERIAGPVGGFRLGDGTFLVPAQPRIDSVTTQLSIFASTGTDVILQQTNESGEVDGAILAVDNTGGGFEAVFVFPPQPAGSFVKIFTSNQPPGIPPIVIEVEPEIFPSLDILAVADDKVSFEVGGRADQTLLIDRSFDLDLFLELGSVTVTGDGSIRHTVPITPGASAEFFRARAPLIIAP